MGDYETFYEGMDYGLDPESGFTVGYHIPASQIGLATDARTANQLKTTSEKISTGASTIEVQGTIPNIAEAIPNQHLEEINRLKKLTGVDLTFHGPLVEPTGIGKDNWDESQRRQAEEQMWIGVERAHKLEPEGNIVVTLHTSNGLPEPRTKVRTEDGKMISSSLAVIDERTGKFGVLPKPKEDYLTGRKADVDTELDRLNEENWAKALSNLNLDMDRASDVFRVRGVKHPEKVTEEMEGLTSIYKLSKEDPQTYQKKIAAMGMDGQEAEQQIEAMNYGGIFIRDGYVMLQELFNQAYDSAERDKNKETIKKLDNYKDKIAPTLEKYKKDPTNIMQLQGAVREGLQLLGSIEAPQVFRPMEEFAIDKASETFSNLAVRSYDKFGKTSPILSLENPPAGMGLARGEEIRKLVEESRKKFAEKAQVEFGLSAGEAENQAEKLIGVTWDIGHINMLRKYGFKDKDIIGETKKVAPYIKHVHLSDNFGMEHTELPMGMGNVPTKEHMELISEYNAKAKKIIETGDWYQHFQTTPFTETLAAFGSPVYAVGAAPYWNQQKSVMGGYFSGYGTTLPEQHFSVYGGGWSGLPAELGGQGAGGRSRLSGAPTE